MAASPLTFRTTTLFATTTALTERREAELTVFVPRNRVRLVVSDDLERVGLPVPQIRPIHPLLVAVCKAHPVFEPSVLLSPREHPLERVFELGVIR